MRNARSQVLGISLTAFALLSGVAGAGWTHRPDLSVILAVQSRASGFLDAAGSLISAAGALEFTGVLLMVIVAGMFLKGRRRLAGRLLFAFLIASLVELSLKMLLPVPPIPERLARIEDFAPLAAVEQPYPYPSGHMLRSTVLLGAVYLLSKSRGLGAIFALYLAAMGISRIYLGVHWPSDVIGGFLLGVVALAWAFKAEKKP